MSPKNTLLVLSFATLFALSINAGEETSVALHEASEILSFFERKVQLDREAAEIDAAIKALDGKPIPVRLHLRQGNLVKALFALNKEATELRDKITTK